MALPRCDYILYCSHKEGVPARRGESAPGPGVLVSARKLRDLKAAPEDTEIEVIEPVERGTRALQAAALSLPSSEEHGQ